MLDKLRNAFVKAFGIESAKFSPDWTPDDVSGWDSLGHLRLVTAIEEQFGIQLEVDDIMEMDRVNKIIEILKKYGIS